MINLNVTNHIYNELVIYNREENLNKEVRLQMLGMDNSHASIFTRNRCQNINIIKSIDNIDISQNIGGLTEWESLGWHPANGWY